MKYLIVLKYNYSYVSSGNYYKKAEREYYQLLAKDNSFRMFALGYGPSDIQLKIQSVTENEIACTHTFSIYSKPYTFAKEHEIITNSFVLRRGEAIESKCYDTYWIYARGGENAPATLRVEWIEYEQFYNECLENAKESALSAKHFAALLIKMEDYDVAFRLLDAVGEDCYELGLCYEMGYGTAVDLDRALEIYLNIKYHYQVDSGIERILEKKEHRKVTVDEVKKTVLLERIGKYKKAYGNSVIPREIENRSPSELRRNVELRIIWFLTLGRPHNDPFGHHTHTMRYLAEYYDLINGVPEAERKVYYEQWEEKDEYEGGTNTKERFYPQRIIETLRAEAEKGDVIAMSVLALQYYDDIEDHAYFAEKLLDKGRCSKDYECGMAFYFLGLYHRLIAQNAEKSYDYDYSKGKKYTYKGTDIEADIAEYAAKNGIQYDSLSSLLSKLRSAERNLEWRLEHRETKVAAELEEVRNYIIYVYKKNYDQQSKIYNEHTEKSLEYFDIALKYGFHLAAAPLAEKIVSDWENYPKYALELLQKHEPYIPYIYDSFVEKYYEIMKKLKGTET